MIRFTCPECAEASRLSEELRGMSIACPHCRVTVPVPRWHAVEDERDAPMEPARPEQYIPEAAPPSPARRRLALFATCAAISLAAIALSCALAGNGILKMATLLALLFLGVIVAGGFIALIRAGFEGNLRGDAAPGLLSTAGWVAYIGGTLGLCLLVHHAFAVASVHVDNYGGGAVRLLIDGKEWVAVAPNRGREVSLRMGKYSVEVRSDAGQLLDTMQATVGDAGPYILNVLGKQVYARGRKDYSSLSFSFGGPPPEERLTGKWIKADVDHLFTTPPTSVTVSVRRGQGFASATRTYIRRGEPTKRK